ncbi:anti-sigma factor [Lichenihabitans psoromatis]|uniref:anti-sigma factor n=1 Tax=Lichenihabitans psoromatis TaxID=2528642 RepID=UPI0010355B05|nr:anti-sigma factor [Lichenihabitans psoromatis]
MKRMQRVFGDIDALRFVDHRLDDERRAAFLAHLSDDPEQAERIEHWSRQNDVIQAAFAGIAHETVPLWLRLDHMTPERDEALAPIETTAPLKAKPVVHLALPAKPRRHRLKDFRVAALALAAAITMGYFVSRDVMPRRFFEGHQAEVRPPEAHDPIHRLIDRAADAYRTYAIDPLRPVEIASAQQAQLDNWFQRRLSIAVHAPDLRSEGWLLLGGRLAPGDLGPGAYFVFENEAGERLGFYVARTDAAPKTSMIVTAGNGESSAAWIEGPIGLVLSVNKDSAWLSKNIDWLRASIKMPASD